MNREVVMGIGIMYSRKLGECILGKLSGKEIFATTGFDQTIRVE